MEVFPKKEALLKLKELAEQKTVCLVCYEANARFCHRSYVAAAMNELANGSFEITHLDPGAITGFVLQKLQADISHPQ